MKWSNGNRWRSLCRKHENSNVWFHITTWPQATILKPHLTLKLVLGASAKCGKVPLFIWKKGSCETIDWSLCHAVFAADWNTSTHKRVQTRLHAHAFMHSRSYTHTHTDTLLRTQTHLHTTLLHTNAGTPKIAMLLQFLTIDHHFVRKGSHFVAPRQHRPRPQERKEKEGEREREDVKTWG